MDVVAVVPACNEAATIHELLDGIYALDRVAVIVVDDGSTDATGDIVRRFPESRVVRHEQRLGYGRALIDGFAAALAIDAKIVVTIDADGQHRPEQIPRLVDWMGTDLDIVSGSRYLPGSDTQGVTPEERRAVNMTITAEINETTGWKLTDAFCGFKAYRAASLARLRLSECGYGMPLELWARAYLAGLKIVEQAVDRIYGASRKFGGGLDDPELRLAYYRSVWRRGLEAS